MNAIPQTSSFQVLTLSRDVRPLPAFERRERDFGVGYGNSSGYASARRYTRESGNQRFRVA